MRIHAFRLHPGQNIREEIDKYVLDNKISAGAILTCVGNLSKAVLRMADANITKTWEGSFEIVSVVGTVKAGTKRNKKRNKKVGPFAAPHPVDEPTQLLTSRYIRLDISPRDHWP